MLSGYEAHFFILLGLSLLFGFLIGTEREMRGKPAGISTNTFVIGGAAMFTFISLQVDPNSPARIAAQVVAGGATVCGVLVPRLPHVSRMNQDR